jgi:hypothetical protein
MFDIRSFLGLAGYYRRFIEGFSKISKPMTELLAKGNTFEWKPRRETCFPELKKRLTTTPVLTMPDVEKPFSIYCDNISIRATVEMEKYESLCHREFAHTHVYDVNLLERVGLDEELPTILQTISWGKF